MARNKYPEVTEERILEAAQRLFLEKGYDNTTIQDIVDQLGGLTKGAVYHHFKSKEEILNAVSDRMFFQNNPFEAVKRHKDLNGLEKLREAARLNQSDSSRVQLTAQMLPLKLDSRLLAELIQSNLHMLTPYYQELLEEGNRDGSLHTEYPRELAELLPFLTSVWLMPAVFPASKEEIRRKFAFLRDMLERLGVPLFDESLQSLVDQFFDQLPELE